MLIQCRLIRKDGTLITIKDKDGKDVDYHFKPTAKQKGDHVCTVKNESHIETLLNIPEAYNEWGQEPREPEVGQAQPEEEVEEFEGDLDPETMNNGDLIKWATARGMNPKSVQSIVDYVKDNNDVELEYGDDVQEVDLIREAVKLEIEED